MAHGSDGGRFAAWGMLVGLSPLLVSADSLRMGLALGSIFLVVHSATAAVALLLPASFGKARGFQFALLAGAVAVSLSASLVRLLDPFLFELASARLFIVPFTIPVMGAAALPVTMADREVALERLIHGVGYAAAIIIMGAGRELLASGAISRGFPGTTTALLPLMSQPAGALILIGLTAAAFKSIIAGAKGQRA